MIATKVMEPAFSIDWVRYSCKPGVAVTSIVPRLDGFEYQGEIPPLKNYHEGADYRLCRVDINKTSDAQGLLVTMTGDNLRSAAVWGNTPLDLVRAWANMPGIKFSRIDLAIDIIDGRANPWDICTAFKEKRLTTKARAYSVVHSADAKGCTGLTVYLGSRTSQIFLRAYDKAREQGADFPWTRVEVECKGDFARGVFEALCQKDIVEVTKNVVRNFVRGVEWLDSITYGTKGRLVRPIGRKLTDHEKWIRDVALPAVMQAYQKRQPEVIETFAGLNWGEILIRDSEIEPPADDKS